MRNMLLAALAFTAAAAFAGGKTAEAGGKKAAMLEEGRTVYEANCAACHGPNGQGDGAAAAALDPKPRNFTDAAYMSKRSAETLRKVISEGGQSVGLSPVMVAWQGSLTPAQIDAVLAYVQSFGKARKAKAAK